MDNTNGSPTGEAEVVALGAQNRAPLGRMSVADRNLRIYEVVSELIVESGAAGVTFKAIAQRMGVSRQWLYKFYPDIDAIFVVVYNHGRQLYFREETPAPTDPVARAAYLKRRCDRYLELPVACAVVGSMALNFGIRDKRAEHSLRTMILANLETQWIQPMVDAGYDRGQLYGSLLTFLNVLFGLIIAVDQKLTNRETASNRLQGLLDAVVNMGILDAAPVGAA
jgi:AcrR family transcriptional regulator